MAMTMVFEDQFEMPLGFDSLSDFRGWALSDEYPQRGRVDFVEGRIEIDMSAEELFTHGSPKVEITIVLGLRVKRLALGHLFVDRTRVSNDDAKLSAEPDIVYVSGDAIDSGRVRLISKASGGSGEYVEVEGAPDMVAEIVSDGSVTKDTKRLPLAYYKAGIREYWVIDARREPLLFQIHRPGATSFEAVEATDGYLYSGVFGCWFRLGRQRDARGNWVYDLRSREQPA